MAISYWIRKLNALLGLFEIFEIQMSVDLVQMYAQQVGGTLTWLLRMDG